MTTLNDIRFPLVGGGPMDGASVSKPRDNPPDRIAFQVGDRLSLYKFDRDTRRYRYQHSKHLKNRDDIPKLCESCNGVMIQTKKGGVCITPACEE